jgi:hypothetical protein
MRASFPLQRQLLLSLSLLTLPVRVVKAIACLVTAEVEFLTEVLAGEKEGKRR